MVFGGNIPIGAGLSSSAALTCGTAWGLNYLFDLGYENEDLVLKAIRATTRFPVGSDGWLPRWAALDRRHVVRCLGSAQGALPGK